MRKQCFSFKSFPETALDKRDKKKKKKMMNDVLGIDDNTKYETDEIAQFFINDDTVCPRELWMMEHTNSDVGIFIFLKGFYRININIIRRQLSS